MTDSYLADLVAIIIETNRQHEFLDHLKLPGWPIVAARDWRSRYGAKYIRQLRQLTTVDLTMVLACMLPAKFARAIVDDQGVAVVAVYGCPSRKPVCVAILVDMLNVPIHPESYGHVLHCLATAGYDPGALDITLVQRRNPGWLVPAKGGRELLNIIRETFDVQPFQPQPTCFVTDKDCRPTDLPEKLNQLCHYIFTKSATLITDYANTKFPYLRSTCANQPMGRYNLSRDILTVASGDLCIRTVQETWAHIATQICQIVLLHEGVDQGLYTQASLSQVLQNHRLSILLPVIQESLRVLPEKTHVLLQQTYAQLVSMLIPQLPAETVPLTITQQQVAQLPMEFMNAFAQSIEMCTDDMWAQWQQVDAHHFEDAGANWDVLSNFPNVNHHCVRLRSSEYFARFNHTLVPDIDLLLKSYEKTPTRLLLEQNFFRLRTFLATNLVAQQYPFDKVLDTACIIVRPSLLEHTRQKLTPLIPIILATECLLVPVEVELVMAARQDNNVFLHAHQRAFSRIRRFRSALGDAYKYGIVVIVWVYDNQMEASHFIVVN